MLKLLGINLRFCANKAAFDNMTLVAAALVLGSGFNLSRISRMRLEDKVVSTLSYFLSDAKFYVPELQLLYAKRIQQVYDV